jgi:uncharacterized repeat protein (TIGR02543 family)
MPVIPIKNGFAFEGWYSDEDFSELYDFNKMIIDNITLYAKWVSN